MKTSIHGRGQRRAVNPDWFTGRTWMRVLSEKIGARGQDMYHVHFELGSRTKLHAHDGDQILIGTRGRGSLETFRGGGRVGPGFRARRARRIAIGDGDVVRIPAGTLHTHGAVGRATFSHIAINLLARGKRRYGTAWYETGPGGVVSGAI